MGIGWVFEFDVGVAVSRLTQRCAFRELFATPELPDFLARKTRRFLCTLVDFLTVYPSQLIKQVQTIGNSPPISK